MFERHQQIRAQASFLPGNGIEISAAEQPLEHSLGQISCFIWIASLPARKSIKRPPVDATKLFEGFPCGWRFTLCGQNQAPMSCSKRSPFKLRARAPLFHDQPFGNTDEM